MKDSKAKATLGVGSRPDSLKPEAEEEITQGRLLFVAALPLQGSQSIVRSTIAGQQQVIYPTILTPLQTAYFFYFKTNGRGLIGLFGTVGKFWSVECGSLW